MKKPPAIEFSRVGASRGLTSVLRDVHFKIGQGESVAILGPNGSGKSTLIKLMTRELYPSDGAVRLFGRESWDVLELRSKLGIISNDWQALFAQDMKGFDVVLSGFFSSVGTWTNNRVTPSMRQKTERVFKKMGIAYLRDRSMTKISSGEARRMLIARALVHSPKTLVFDEPTNSLDLQAQKELQQMLRRLAQMKLGLILATHHLPDIIPEIKRVIVLKNGKITGDGAKEEMLTTKKLSSVFGVKIEVIQKDGFFHAA